MRREDVLELRAIDERLVEVRVLAGGVAEDVFDAGRDQLLGEVFAAGAGEHLEGFGRRAGLDLRERRVGDGVGRSGRDSCGDEAADEVAARNRVGD